MKSSSYLVTFSKTPELRYTSILNIQKIMLRTIRRGKIPVAFSNGFHPQPKIRFPCPLPLGYTGKNEVIEFELVTEIEPASLLESLQKSSVIGMVFKAVEIIQHRTRRDFFNPWAARYGVEPNQFDFCVDVFVERANSFMAESTVMKSRRGKYYDLRPMVYQIDAAGDRTISMILSTTANSTGRPDEVMQALGFDPYHFHYCRENFLDQSFHPIP